MKLETRNLRFAKPCWIVLGLLWAATIRAADGILPKLTPIPLDKPYTFAVLGDNRGDDSGRQPETFRQIIRAVNDAAPVFVINTGDMIYGGTEEESRVREQWRLYREAIAPLRAPMFHVPGNHDIWDAPSARIYKEMWGAAYHAFDYGRARFIYLDCESEPGRLSREQFEWLKQELAASGTKLVFIVLHRPLFPVDGAITSSMDKHPEERDRLHQLLVQHRRGIKGVFQGHEHLYHFHERDGVPYYITGGGGANLYVPPELGGFHHFLLVKVDGDSVSVTVRKVGAPTSPLLPPTRVAPGELLESWENGLFWYPWDYTVNAEIATGRSTQGRNGLRLNFDLAQNAWPVLALPRRLPWDLRGVRALSVDLYVPDEWDGALSITPGVQGKEDHEAPPTGLKRGWNRVRTELRGPWLPDTERAAVRSVGWSLTAKDHRLRGSVVFDNFQAEKATASGGVSSELLEGWERPLLWRVTDESVHAESTPPLATEGKHGLKLHFDFSQCRRPTLLAQLNPPWDLSGVETLTLDIYVPEPFPGSLSASLGVRTAENDAAAPATSLRTGWNKVSIDLAGKWLPRNARAAAEQINCILSSPTSGWKGWIILDNLRAGTPRPKPSP